MGPIGTHLDAIGDYFLVFFSVFTEGFCTPPGRRFGEKRPMLSHFWEACFMFCLSF